MTQTLQAEVLATRDGIRTALTDTAERITALRQELDQREDDMRALVNAAIAEGIDSVALEEATGLSWIALSHRYQAEYGGS